MSTDQYLFKASGATIKRGNTPVLQGLSWQISAGQQWAVIGPSGCGKTTLLQAIAGELFTAANLHYQTGVRIILVPQQHRFTNLSHTQDFYYQQRFNSFDAEDAPTVEAAYPHLFDRITDRSVEPNITELFSLESIRQRPLIQLSNGENKRLQLAHALSRQPDLLLLDNPFTGLDTGARNALETALNTLTQHGITVILSSTPQRIPSFVTHVLEIKKGGETEQQPAIDFLTTRLLKTENNVPELPAALAPTTAHHSFLFAVRMCNVQVQYGQKQVLQNITWEVRRGERWLLSGGNGAGKSTLLSLITADNPQAYANEIYLFDKRRGSGESIWDIKKNIGYVSPELHLYFDYTATVFDTVASGFFDTIGLFRQLTKEQEASVMQWLEFLQLTAMKFRLLNQLPLGQQRLVLLARALIKNPPLLVLDEPLQGLDAEQSGLFNGVVDALCHVSDQTLIYVSHYQDELPVSIQNHLHLHGGAIVYNEYSPTSQ